MNILSESMTRIEFCLNGGYIYEFDMQDANSEDKLNAKVNEAIINIGMLKFGIDEDILPEYFTIYNDEDLEIKAEFSIKSKDGDYVDTFYVDMLAYVDNNIVFDFKQVFIEKSLKINNVTTLNYLKHNNKRRYYKGVR